MDDDSVTFKVAEGLETPPPSAMRHQQARAEGRSTDGPRHNPGIYADVGASNYDERELSAPSADESSDGDQAPCGGLGLGAAGGPVQTSPQANRRSATYFVRLFKHKLS